MMNEESEDLISSVPNKNNGEERMQGEVRTPDVVPVAPKKVIEVDKPRRGIYLVEPHGRWIAEGKKTIIIKKKKFKTDPKEPLYLIENKLCWGLIYLGTPIEIGPEDFKHLQDKHLVSDEERKKWWGDSFPLYSYQVRSETWAIPQPVSLPRGIQTFVDAKNIKFKEFKDLENKEIYLIHAFAHTSKNINLHEKISKEFESRNQSHSYIDWLDRFVEFLISDWKTYDPIKLIKTKRGQRVVADDHRIVHSWWKLLESGKRMTSSQFKDFTLEEQKKIVSDLHKKIIEAFKKLEWKHDSPLEEKSLLVEKDSIKRKDLENIDDVYVKNLSDEELESLDKQLHEIYKEIGKVTEPLSNAHIFVWREMITRGIPHEIEDPLTDATALDVVEYPTPRGLSKPEIPDAKGEVTLERALKSFPDRIILYDPPQHIHLVGRIVNTGKAPEGHDIDLLFKQSHRDERLIKEFLKVIRRNDPEVAKRLHFVFDPHGPQVGYSVPLYRISYSKLGGSELIRHSPWEYLAEQKIILFKPVVSLKAKSGFGTFEFYRPEELYQQWVADRLSKGIFVQKKYDGRRFQIHFDGKKLAIFTEDRQRDRSDVFQEASEEFRKNFKGSIILDAECVQYDCQGKVVKDKEDICDYIEREKSGWMTVGKRKPDWEKDAVFHIHDILYLNGESFSNKPYSERFEVIKKVIPKGLEHWRPVVSEYADNVRDFKKAFGNVIRHKGSEGAMLKEAGSDYRIKYSGENRTPSWAKFKNLKDVDVLVFSSEEKRRTKTGKGLDNWVYWCAFRIPCNMIGKFPELKVTKNEFNEEVPNVGGTFKYENECYSIIGKSYGTKVKAKKGDVVTVKPVRVRKFETREGKIFYTWMFPLFGEKREKDKPVDTLTKIERIEKVGSAPILEKMRVLLEKKDLSEDEFWQVLKGDEDLISLKTCPFWKDDEICPLKNRFAHPMDYLSRKKMYLRFPVACPFAEHFKCRYVKEYYYDTKEGD